MLKFELHYLPENTRKILVALYLCIYESIISMVLYQYEQLYIYLVKKKRYLVLFLQHFCENDVYFYAHIVGWYNWKLGILKQEQILPHPRTVRR
jgi:hypothetical protein